MAQFRPPKGVTAVTTEVFSDEPCFFLAEENRLSEDSKSMCRYQLLKVVRNDTLVTAYVNLGPADNFEADQFTMLGGTIDENGRGEAVHTVGELQDGAAEIRSRKPRRELEPWDLQSAFQNHVEERSRQATRKSTFGFGGKLVRT